MSERESSSRTTNQRESTDRFASQGRGYSQEYIDSLNNPIEGNGKFTIGGVEQEGFIADGINAFTSSGAAQMLEDSARSAGVFGNMFTDTALSTGKAIKGAGTGLAEFGQGGVDLYNAGKDIATGDYNFFESLDKVNVGLERSRKGLANVAFGIGGVIAAGPYEMFENIAFDVAMRISPEAEAFVGEVTNKLRNSVVDWNTKYFDNTINDDNIDSVVGILSVGAVAGGAKLGLEGIKAVPKVVDVTLSALSSDAKKVLIQASKDKDISTSLMESGLDKPTENGINIEDNFNTNLGQTTTTKSFPQTLAELVEASKETGEKITGEQLTEAINNVSEKKLPATADDVKVDIEWQRGEAPARDEVNTALDASLGGATSIGKGSTSRVMERLMAVGLNEFEAVSAIKKRLAENKELGRDKNKADTVPGAFETIRAMNWIRKSSDLLEEINSEKSYSYDKENAPFASEALITLEKAGIVDKRIVDGMYEFRLNEGAKKYLSPDEYGKMTSGEGFKHIPVDLFEGVKAKKVKKVAKLETTQTTTENKKVKEPTTNTPKKLKLQDVDKELGRDKQDRRGSEAIYDDAAPKIEETLVTQEPVTPLLRSQIEELGKRFNLDTSKIFDSITELLDESATLKFLDDMEVVKKDGFTIPTKLKTPSSLKTMLKRDSQVAKDAFEAGVKDQKEVDARLIQNLKEKMNTASEKQKAYYQGRIDNIQNRALTQKNIKAHLLRTIRGLGDEGSSYKWYGNKKQIDNLVNTFTKRIEEISTASQYAKVISDLEKAIEIRNVDALKEKIEDKLEIFRRKQGRYSANKKDIDPQERMVLEVAATAWEDIVRGKNSEDIKAYLDNIETIISVGKEKFENSIMASREVIENMKKVSDSQGLQNGFYEGDNKVRKIKAYLDRKVLGSPPELLWKIVKGNPKSVLWKLFSELNNIANKVTSSHNDFKKIVIGGMDKAGLLTVENMGKLKKHMLTQQADWNKNVYGKDGEFIGHDIFVGKKYIDEAEYIADIKDADDFVANNPAAKLAVNFSRALLDGTWEQANIVSLLHTGVGIGRIDNYYPGKPIRLREAAKDVNDFVQAPGFDTSWQKERTVSNNQFDLDFSRDMHKFIDGEVKYSLMAPQYKLTKDFIKSGALDGINTDSYEFINEYLNEYSNRSTVESNKATQLSSMIGRNLLAGNLTTVITQGFAIPESVMYAGGENLWKASKFLTKEKSKQFTFSRARRAENAASNVLNPDVFERARFASQGIDVAFDFDYANAEAGNLSIENKGVRGVKKFQDAILTPLSNADMGTKYSVWLASYADMYYANNGKEFDFDNGKFESDREAVLHADMMMQMAIGSKDSAHLPPVMRNSLGRVTLMLQSFVVRRYSQLFIRLPSDWANGDKAKVARSYSILATTTLAQTMVSPLWNTILASMGIKDEKEFEERLTGKSDAEVDDIMFALSLKTISSFTPGASNVFDALGNGTGLGVTSAVKQFGQGFSATSKALSDRTPKGEFKDEEYDKAAVESLGLFIPLIGGAPLRELRNWGRQMTKEDDESSSNTSGGRPASSRSNSRQSSTREK